MTIRNKMTLDAAKQELEYIQSIDPKHPGSTFNHDPKVFAEYCNMHANHILASGHHQIALDITNCRDAAFPEFRSFNARHFGAEVLGKFCFFSDFYPEIREALRNNLKR